VAFAVQDFHDLLRLLEQHPEWQADLRRIVLTDELLELPALVRRMAEAQVRTEELLERLTARVDDLAEAQLRTETRVQAQGRRLDAAIGDLLEWRFERRAGAYFSSLARHIRVVDRSALADLLEDAVEQGLIAEGDRKDVMLADLVLTGRRREDGQEIYLVAEISAGIGVDDIRRADDRAAALARLGRPTIPVVAGQRIDPEPAELAEARGVRQVLDGRAVTPPEQS